MSRRVDVEAEQSARDKLLDEIRSIKQSLAKLTAERAEAREAIALSDEIVQLKRDLVDLEINKSKLTEEHERDKRETLHMVGLERKRQEFEVEQAKRETTLSVREENLAADRKRFEEQMEFTSARFEKEVGYLKDLMGQVLDRLPTVTIDKSIEQTESAPARRKAAS